MSLPPGFDGHSLPPGQGRAQLVADLARYLGSWEQSLARPDGMDRGSTDALRQRSIELQSRAVSVGFGGVAHHLARCLEFLQTGTLDVDGLRAALRDLSELAWQAKQELAPGERALVDQMLLRGSPPAQPGGSGDNIAPPPMITYYPNRGAAPVAPPPIVAATNAPPVASVGVRTMLGSAPAAMPSNAPPPLVAPPQSPPPVPPAPLPVVATPDRDASPEPQAAPKLSVKTMFGLRAFNRARPAPEAAAPAPPAARPQPSQEMLGLRAFSESPAPAHAPEPPRLLASSLPPLPARVHGQERPRAASAEMAMEQVLGRKDRDRSGGSGRAKSFRPSGRSRRPRQSSIGGLWIGVIGALAFGSLVVGLIVGWRRLRESTADPRPSIGSASPSSSAAVATAGSSSARPATGAHAITDDQLRSVLDKAHAQGTGESPELRAWVDQQAAMQAKLLETGRCEGSVAACSALFKARDQMQARNPIAVKKKTAQTTDGRRSRWLAGLKLPEKFPVEDEPRVQRIFEKYTDTQLGRALFESMLFRCGSYQDKIREALIREELPQSLLAVVFAESGCEPLAKSRVGAEGLWQFMPEAGRAYHLHIQEDVIDERHSPQKSTEAAIHFLSDLYKKFGAWDLVFAAYNMGPFGLVGRMERAGGGDVGYWDLYNADMLPEETAGYVPTIEAFALILENLQRLKFAGTQMRPPEVTADLDAPPGTRLSLIARAAGTSTVQIRALNLDIKADTVPNIPGQVFAVQVSKDVVWQARDTLQALMSSGSYEDQCVSATFDWGRQRWTAEMEEECRRRIAAAGK